MKAKDTQQFIDFCKQAFSNGFLETAKQDKKNAWILATVTAVIVLLLMLLFSDSENDTHPKEPVPKFLSGSKMLNLDYPFGVFSTNDRVFGTQYYEFSDSTYSVFTQLNDTRFYLFKSKISDLSKADTRDYSGVMLDDMKKGYTFSYRNPLNGNDMYAMIVQSIDKSGKKIIYMVERESRDGYFKPNNSTKHAITYY